MSKARLNIRWTVNAVFTKLSLPSCLFPLMSGFHKDGPRAPVLLHYLHRGAHHLHQPDSARQTLPSAQHQWQPQHEGQHRSRIWTEAGKKVFFFGFHNVSTYGSDDLFFSHSFRTSSRSSSCLLQRTSRRTMGSQGRSYPKNCSREL